VYLFAGAADFGTRGP